MPTPTLAEFVAQTVALADYRNLARENPIPVQLPLGNGENMIVVVAFMEPNNVTLPFNVSWIVVDPDSASYGKVLRRTSALPSVGFRNTWQELDTFEDLIAEQQYWDFSSGFNLGEVDVPQVGAATLDVRGLVILNREYTPDQDSPVVVGGNDPRMSDARDPLPHTHPKLPITMIRGATGVNSWLAKVGTSNTPKPGEVLTITGPGAKDGEWIGEWRRPVKADLVYDGPTFDELEIVGPEGNTLDETAPFTFKANAKFSDGSVLNNVQGSWAVIGNGAYGSISNQTGIFQSLDIDEDQVLRIEVRWTHPESGQLRVKYVDITIVDKTIKLVLTSIELVGVNELEENSIATYSVIAHFDDGTSAGVTPTTFTSSNPGAGAFNNKTGVLEVGELTTDQTTTIAATYAFNGVTKDANLTVRCIDTTIYPSSAVIVGPAEVDEGTSTNFTLRVTFTNGTQKDVAVTDWRSSDEEAGTINPSSGVFEAPNNLFEDKATTLSASYTLEGRTVNGSRQILVKDTTVYPRSAVILGSAAINENTVTQYQFRVSFSNGTTNVVTVSNWALSNPAMGTINKNTGQLVAATDVQQDTKGKVSASYSAFGQTVTAELEVTIKDITNYPVSARVVGNAQMNENTTQTLTFEVTYLDGTKVNEPVTNWTSTNSGAATIGAANGLVTAAVNLQANGTTTVAASWSKYGRTVTADMLLTVRDITNYPVSAVINGQATINEGSTADYTLAVTFADGTTANRSGNWAITGGNGASVNTSGRVTAPANVDVNTPASLTASYTLDGKTVTASAKTVTIMDTTVYPSSARILGPNSLPENTSQTYQLEVTFTDATKAIVPVTNWKSSVISTATIGANTGVLNGLDTTGNKVTKITASYTAAGKTVGAELDVTVTDSTNYPVSAAVEGPDFLDEGDTGNYVLRVTFTDGTNSLVGVIDWASSKTAVGVINPTTGALATNANLKADDSTKVSASYTASGITVSAEKNVTVRDKTVYPVSAIITGGAVVDSLKTEQYELRVTFEDQTTVVMPATEWLSSNTSTAGTIDANGLFTAKENKSGTNINTILTGKYTLDGVTVTATKTIAVHDVTNYPASIAITGPNSVDSSAANGAGSAQYLAKVTYLDGTSADVVGTWGVEGTTPSDPIGSINASGVFTPNQKPGGTTRNITVKVAYTEFGRTVNGTKSVSLVVVPVPSSLAINGPATVNSDSSGTYSAKVTMTDGSVSDVLATWSTTASSTVATLATDGTLAVKHLSADTAIPLHATYTAAGITVAADKTVTGKKAVELASITVSGPTQLASGATGKYVVTANFTDSSTQDVTSTATYSTSVASAGSFSQSTKGDFNAANVSSDTATVLTFDYTAAGVSKQATADLTVKAAVVSGNNRPRFGVAMFSDTDFTGGKTGTNETYNIPYTRWSGIQDFADKVMTNVLPLGTSGETFTLNIGDAQYGYFMHLKSKGTATFTDQAINVPGGFGGIQWTPEGEVGDNYDPIEVTYDCHDGNGPQQWLVYRTDWDSLGAVTFKVTYA
jgi:hypothetical protein